MAPLEYTLTTTRPAGRGRTQWTGETRLVVHERTGRRCDGPGVGAVTDGNSRPCFGIRARVVASSSTERATTLASTSARLA